MFIAVVTITIAGRYYSGRGPGGLKLIPNRNLNCTEGGTGNGGGVGCTEGKVVCSPLCPGCSLPPTTKKGGPPLTIPPPPGCSLKCPTPPSGAASISNGGLISAAIIINVFE